MIEDLKKHQFKKKVYEGGIENSQAFKHQYKIYYKDPVSPVIYTQIVEDLSEANGRKAGIYNQTKGILINYRGESPEEKLNEFQKDLIEFVSKYDEIIQVAKSNFVNLAIPEHIRTKRIVNRILQSNSVPAKRLYRRKKREKVALVRYAKPLAANVKSILKFADADIVGEYRKNSNGDELIILTDTKKLSKNTQSKELPPDLFWHLKNLDLLEILDDRELYKKFYFKAEFINNVGKYIRIHKKKIK